MERGQTDDSADITFEPSLSSTASEPTVTLYVDAAGAYWRPASGYVPVSTGEVNQIRQDLEAAGGHLIVESLPEPDSRELDMRWYDAHEAELCRLYPGEWIAVDGGALIGHNSQLSELLKSAVGLKHPDPLLWRVPSEPDALVIL